MCRYCYGCLRYCFGTPFLLYLLVASNAPFICICKFVTHWSPNSDLINKTPHYYDTSLKKWFPIIRCTKDCKFLAHRAFVLKRNDKFCDFSQIIVKKGDLRAERNSNHPPWPDPRSVAVRRININSGLMSILIFKWEVISDVLWETVQSERRTHFEWWNRTMAAEKFQIVKKNS